MIEYEYSVREVVRKKNALEKELLDLGNHGWEVITILEKSLPGELALRYGWIIVSRKVIESKKVIKKKGKETQSEQSSLEQVSS